LTLIKHFETLFTIIEEDAPDKYREIISLCKGHKAKLSNGNETIIFTIKNDKIVILEKIKEKDIPTGFFVKKGIIGLMDGQLTLQEAIRVKLIDCRGTEHEIILFFKILRLLLFVSARSNRAYQLWQSFKE